MTIRSWSQKSWSRTSPAMGLDQAVKQGQAEPACRSLGLDAQADSASSVRFWVYSTTWCGPRFGVDARTAEAGHRCLA